MNDGGVVSVCPPPGMVMRLLYAHLCSRPNQMSFLAQSVMSLRGGLKLTRRGEDSANRSRYERVKVEHER
jgi:hypothetical protein